MLDNKDEEIKELKRKIINLESQLEIEKTFHIILEEETF